MKTKSIFCQAMFAKSSYALTKLRMTHGPAGLGIYMCVLEALFDEPSSILPRDYATLAFRFNISEELVKSVIEDFNLFALSDDGASFYCELLLQQRTPRPKSAPQPKQQLPSEPQQTSEQSEQSEQAILIPQVYKDPTLNPLPPLTYDQKVALEIQRFSTMPIPDQVDLLRQDPEWLKYCAMDYRITEDELRAYLDRYETSCIDRNEMHYNIFDLKYRFSVWLNGIRRYEAEPF